MEKKTNTNTNSVLHLLKKIIIILHIQIHKYNLLKCTFIMSNTPQIQFEFGRKIGKNLKIFEKVLAKEGARNSGFN